MKHALVAGAGAAILAAAIGAATNPNHHAVAQSAPPAALPATTQISDVAERVVDSVVNISTTQTVEAGPFLFDPFFADPSSPFHGEPDQRKAKSLGSGVIVSEDGKILTNAHVVRNAEEILVTLHDGTEHEAKLLGTDPKSDLAVLKLERAKGNLRPLPFADSSRLRLGEVVLAVGNPFGVGQAVTMGIVSATGRASMGIVDYEDFIQTDAAINPGNSGGALVNLRGELVGINTAILSRTGGYQGIGFAIPTNMASPIMNALIADGKVNRGWLGVTLAPLDARAQAKFRVATGVLVAQVGTDTPAEKAGLSAGDVIVAVDGTEVRDVARLRNAVAIKGAGKTTTLDVRRDGKLERVKVTLGALPEQQKLRRVRVR
ncbi:MAG: trypsin-like peptidase domain-containing protein [Deltaproteobacteria bacterium]|nr:trypsin-like peptidase domain-containing protein [Kofleriaceae bacterium]